MTYGWIDSHAHLMEEELYDDVEGILNRSKEVGLSRILTVCVNLEQVKKALILQEKYSMLDLAFGFHPEDVDMIDESKIDALEALLKSGKLVALGEIGLDYYWVKDNKEKQKKLFERQLELANQYQVPVLIHMREASQDTYDILKKHVIVRGGIMHCYSGSTELAKQFIALGFYISIAGTVTFKNANTVKEVVKKLPLESLLIETDAPFLTPVPFRGKKNEPAYVVYTGQEICLLKDLSEETLKEAITKNYQKLLQVNF